MRIHSKESLLHNEFGARIVGLGSRRFAQLAKRQTRVVARRLAKLLYEKHARGGQLHNRDRGLAQHLGLVVGRCGLPLGPGCA